MFDAQDIDPLPLPPQYDGVLAAGAILGYGGLAVFLTTQADAAMRVGWVGILGVVAWCLALSTPSAISWMTRPQITHMTYAVRLAQTLNAMPDAPRIIPPRMAFAARHWVWGSCGMLGASAWVLAGGVDFGYAGGRVLLCGFFVDLITLVLGQLGGVCIAVRIMGPSLAAVDDMFRAARGDLKHGKDCKGAKIIKLRPRKRPRKGGEEGDGLRGEAR